MKLAVRAKPHYRDLGAGVSLGYRRNAGAGAWSMRLYVGGKYVSEGIGAADDLADSDGRTVLDFRQAQAKAHAMVKAARIAAASDATTVADAIAVYVEARERKSKARSSGGEFRHENDARSRLRKHVGAKLAAKQIATLTEADLADWRAGLKLSAASVRRTCNDLRACLNAAAKRGKAQLPATIRDTIKDGLAGEGEGGPAASRMHQILTDGEVRAVIEAAKAVDDEINFGGDLVRMILALAATGARFSQLARATVGDLEQGRLAIPASFKGRSGAAVRPHVRVPIGGDVVGELARGAAGRGSLEPLLIRPRYEQTAVGVFKQVGRGPWRAASELRDAWALIIKRAALPKGVVVYSLRHSFVVRALRSGLPTRLIAELCDTSGQMVERHYARFVTDAMADLAQRVVVPLIEQPNKIVSIVRA
jgi:integrase